MTQNIEDVINTNFLNIYNVIYYYYGTPKLQSSFQVLNFHKNIVIEVNEGIIGDEIICDKLKYPKHYRKIFDKIYEKNELFDKIRKKNKVIIKLKYNNIL